MTDATGFAANGGKTVTLHLLRHGLVENPDGILYGRLPGYHLSAVGRAMAERLAAHLDARYGATITRLVSSPLERARQTASPLAAARGLEPVIDSRLIESANHFEGTKFAVGDGVLKRPANWPRVRDPFTPSWGEPYLAIARRMIGAVYAAEAALGDGEHAVLVSHQLPIWTLRRFVEGKRLWHNPSKRQCALASLTSLTIRDGVIAAVGYSEPAADLVPGRGGGVGA